MREGCPVLGWAASGAMALTGQPGGVPAMSPAPAFALLGEVMAELGEVTRKTGTAVLADPAELLTGRAALAGFTRRGQVSAGGSARLLRAADGWCAVTLSRPDDMAAVPAIIGTLGLEVPCGELGDARGDGGQPGAAWTALKAAALARSATAVADAAQLLGVPAGALPVTPLAPDRRPFGPTAPWPPWRISRIAAASPDARLVGALVIDLSSMWAGPLCARLLGLGGARVVKVETPGRPDGTRAGNREFFNWLHAGHQSVVLDFRSASGRDALAALLAAADVVIEASRPRALEQLGLAPSQARHRDGQVWLSITGYGRLDPDRVAFGDDAAVAGGLVGRVPAPGGAGHEPVFCADAVADPLTGVCGALAVAQSLANGGGQLIDLSMQAVAAGFSGAYRAVHHGSHHAWNEGAGSDAIVRCDAGGRDQAVLPPSRPAPAGRAAEFGADTASVLGWLSR